mgnify:CR=1 FL=1
MNPQMLDVINKLEACGKDATRIGRRALGAMFREYRKGIRQAVPLRLSGKNAGSANDTIQSEVNYKVFTKRGNIISAKVGVSVGKKNPRQKFAKGESFQEFKSRVMGLYSKGKIALPHAHLLALGTVNRWTGAKDVRKRKGGKLVIVGKRATGNPTLFRGRVTKSPFVMQGVSSRNAAAEAAFRLALNTLINEAFKK